VSSSESFPGRQLVVTTYFANQRSLVPTAHKLIVKHKLLCNINYLQNFLMCTRIMNVRFDWFSRFLETSISLVLECGRNLCNCRRTCLCGPTRKQRGPIYSYCYSLLSATQLCQLTVNACTIASPSHSLENWEGTATYTLRQTH